MATSKTTDTRISRSSARGATANRESRSAADNGRKDDGLAITPEDRLRMIRSEFTQEALPQVPAIPGWHLCWLSTTSSYDPIAKRMRMGYEPVLVDEIPGFEVHRAKGGNFEGAISCNEMVLFKVPEDVYQAIMLEFHHNQPQQEEEALKQQIEAQQSGFAEETKGKATATVEGFDDLAVARKAPAFAA